MKDDARARWATYLNRRMGSRSQADFAKLVEVTDGQLSKWRSGTAGVKPETVIAIARKLGDSPLHALAEVGYLTADEVGKFRVPHEFGLDSYTDLELSMEIVRRVQAGTATHQLTAPLEIEDDAPAGAPVRRLRPKANVSGAREDLAEVAFETTINHDNDHDNYDS